ncbi:hypothetical protein JDV09_07580 [Mycobacterium sp. Y57]|uniref:hypothetical protein n=1 Tax=Mycolicibacterium xanthum TaxID=2796469 RepID=UPI001C853F44|nr:hypothetical protein [Mycolicibacterium xanthum]MBX7431967.1 hypothetical protein [Mycolicibacterium xanthum]
MSQATVGVLLLAGAALIFGFGVLSRVVIGRRRETKAIRAMVRTVRHSRIARVLFGSFEDDVLDDDELDTMILMPAVVVACGLILIGVFLLGYGALA